MSYLNLDLNYFSHPKTMRLTGLLGKEAEVLPIKLWCYCGKHHCQDGKLSGYSPQEVEAVVKWWGKSGDMVTAMLKTAHIRELSEGGYEVVDWLEHNGHLAMFKERARKAAQERWGISETSNATSNAKDVPKQSPNQPTIPTKPNQTNKVLEWFEAVWGKYPRKDGKKDALRHFWATVKTEEDWVSIKKAVENYMRHLEINKVEPQFIKNGKTFFNNWHDWVDWQEPIKKEGEADKWKTPTAYRK